ncbi:MAG: gluconate:H+ symporter, GntP family [Verrucomicrobiota bacterium]|jgi:GntP family gluconate:H+ symporter
MFTDQTRLLVVAALGVLGLILLIARFKLNAFLALTLASLFVGLSSRMNLIDVAKAFQEGVGTTLGFIAVIVGLGTMIGKLLAESGGAGVVANTFIQWLGHAQLPVTMVIVAFIVGLPVFFGVGVLLLIPIVLSLSRETRLPLLALGLPMAAGLSASHCLVPPHVGPMVAIEKLGADVGQTIAWSIAIGFPVALTVGVAFTKWAVPRFGAGSAVVEMERSPGPLVSRRAPGFGITIFTIALPVVLMLLDTLTRFLLPAAHPARLWAGFIGSPIVSMLIAVLVAFYTFGSSCGFNRRQILKFTEDCVGPAANIMLVVGAGGGFSRVLEKAGVAQAIADAAGALPISPLLLGWVVAVLIRIAVGSATVTITMTASLLAPIADSSPHLRRELLVVALGAGSMIASHLNDGGFWFVKEYLNLTVEQTLKTWTVMVTIMSVVTLLVVLLINVFLNRFF